MYSLLGEKKVMCSDYHYCSQDELSIPYRDLKLIEKRLAQFKKNGEKAIPLEEFEKELSDLLENESH
jgi:hypothetical protein